MALVALEGWGISGYQAEYAALCMDKSKCNFPDKASCGISQGGYARSLPTRKIFRSQAEQVHRPYTRLLTFGYEGRAQ